MFKLHKTYSMMQMKIQGLQKTALALPKAIIDVYLFCFVACVLNFITFPSKCSSEACDAVDLRSESLREPLKEYGKSLREELPGYDPSFPFPNLPKL